MTVLRSDAPSKAITDLQSHLAPNEIHCREIGYRARRNGKNVSALKFRAVNAPPNIELLWGLKPQEIDLILGAARPRRVAAKTVMTRQGDRSDHLYLLWQGRARYFYTAPDGKNFIMIWITPGHTFAEAGLAPRPHPYLLSTEAVCDSVVLIWDSSTIRALGQRFPRLFENIASIALDYLSWYTSAYTALNSDSAQQRLANLLVALAPSIGRTVSSGIEIDATNEELASSANGRGPARYANIAANSSSAHRRNSSLSQIEGQLTSSSSSCSA